MKTEIIEIAYKIYNQLEFNNQLLLRNIIFTRILLFIII